MIVVIDTDNVQAMADFARIVADLIRPSLVMKAVKEDRSPWATKEDAMAFLGCGDSKLSKYRSNGEVKTRKPGKEYQYLWSDLQKVKL
ncbi:hypothetical protein UFOVP1596_30 [uncultured Caudovirales phage]|uniref:Helix-turn-helix domain containing protein n=1 Tax=uncultured Caudovirales phage TaxID=2100421 RepID=A0A6J5STJ4_9CAUD|nr:hypothetical protein UFOVP1596_30 [uncultured Caudovirales phage]